MNQNIFLLFTIMPSMVFSNLCDKLDRKLHDQIHMQAVTMTSQVLYVIESDRLYEIPVTNIDTVRHRVLLYDNDNSPLSSVNWFDRKWLRMGRVELNQPKVLRTIQILYPSESHQQAYVHYQFYTEAHNDYVLDNQTRQVLSNTTVDLRLHSSSLVSDESNNSSSGYLFGWNVRSKPNSTRVVVKKPIFNIFGPQWKSNLPGMNIYTNELSFNIETDYKRKHIRFTPADAAKQGLKRFLDMFVYLPFGFIYGNNVYLLIVPTQRVYIFARVPIPINNTSHSSTGSQSYYQSVVRSKSWKSFFCCPTEHCDDEGTEQSQMEYMFKPYQRIRLLMYARLMYVGAILLMVAFMLGSAVRSFVPNPRPNIVYYTIVPIKMNPIPSEELNSSSRQDSEFYADHRDVSKSSADSVSNNSTTSKNVKYF